VSSESVIATMTSTQDPASLDSYEYGPVHLFETQNGLFERHLLYDNVIERTAANFSRNEPGAFEPLHAALLTHGDYYMHLADLTSYIQAQERLGELYRDPRAWARKAISHVAGSGRFSSDRTIAEYASGIWGVKPCPVR
jgi:glycogen phosphorylase